MRPTEQYRTYLKPSQNSRKNLKIEQANIERKSKKKLHLKVYKKQN